MEWIAIAAIGVGIGFLAGVFGKGGSAIATPLLHAVGVPAIVALAAPLPAAIPSTTAASVPYWRRHFVDGQVSTWSIAVGAPATVVGAVATHWIGGDALLRLTDVVVVMLGARLLLAPRSARGASTNPPSRVQVSVVAVLVGLMSGLLANSGGFLLAPLYLAVLHLPIKRAFASSLVVSAALAIPGTVVHAALGHIDWRVVGVFGAFSIPLSYVGARVAIATNPDGLERAYGGVLTALGLIFVVAGR